LIERVDITDVIMSGDHRLIEQGLSSWTGLILRKFIIDVIVTSQEWVIDDGMFEENKMIDECLRKDIISPISIIGSNK